jgi:hypothetical protein
MKSALNTISFKYETISLRFCLLVAEYCPEGQFEKADELVEQ